MYRKDSMEGHPDIAARRRWVWAVLCVLLVFSAMLHLVQATPPQADGGEIQFITVHDENNPCEPGHESTVGHCHMTTACSPYAPLSASPATFVEAATHPSPSAEAIQVGRAISPQLQPPQYSLDA
jgi:hypothetical protein